MKKSLVEQFPNRFCVVAWGKGWHMIDTERIRDGWIPIERMDKIPPDLNATIKKLLARD